MPDEELKAGPEMDALVAIKVMGWERQYTEFGELWLDPTTGEFRARVDAWHPSTEIPDAWKVVGMLRDKRWLVVIKIMPEGFPFYYEQDDPRHFYARCVCSADYQPMRTHDECRRYIHGHTLAVAQDDALAICRCALRVVEEEGRYPVRAGVGETPNA